MTQYMCSWNGSIPIAIEAPTTQAAREKFAEDAQERGYEDVNPSDVTIEGAG